jgi:hypothetical protein
MADFEWNLSSDELVVYDKDTDLAIVFSRDDGVNMVYDNEAYYIDPADIHHVLMVEPKLLKKGMIAIYADDDNMFYLDNGSVKFHAVVEFGKKYKDAFYLIYSVLRDNGIDMLLL